MNQRHTQILNIITKNKKIEVSKLSEIIGVSQVTIRKDLDVLESNGIILREHGFAKLNDSDDINNRLAYHYDSKKRVAKLAAESICDGETVMIESGSCCALLALEIASTKKDVTIITNSAFIADYVRKQTNGKIVLLGGEYQKESQVMVGPMMRRCAEMFFVDKLFVGTDGFTVTSGFTGNDFMRTEAVRDMAKQAEHLIIVTESEKFHQKGVVSLVKVNDVHYVYTDSNIPDDIEDYLTSQNVKVFKTK